MAKAMTKSQITAAVAEKAGISKKQAGAALEAVKALMFDSLKRAKWAAPDGTEYDDTAAQQQLQKLYEQLNEEVNEGAVDAGAYASWALGQEGW